MLITKNYIRNIIKEELQKEMFSGIKDKISGMLGKKKSKHPFDQMKEEPDLQEKMNQLKAISAQTADELSTGMSASGYGDFNFGYGKENSEENNKKNADRSAKARKLAQEIGDGLKAKGYEIDGAAGIKNFMYREFDMEYPLRMRQPFKINQPVTSPKTPGAIARVERDKQARRQDYDNNQY